MQRVRSASWDRYVESRSTVPTGNVCVGCGTVWCHNCTAGRHMVADQTGYLCHRCFDYGRLSCQLCFGLEDYSELTACGICDKYMCRGCTADGQTSYGPSFCIECVDVLGPDDSSSGSDGGGTAPAFTNVYVYDTVVTPPGHPPTVLVAAHAL